MINDPRPIHLLFAPGNGFYGWLVRKWTRSPYGHVLIAFRTESWWITEATREGVIVYPMEKLRPANYLAVPTRVGMTNPVRDFLFKAAQGQPYDYLDALRAGIGLPPRNRGYECAELVQRMFEVAGGLLPWSPTPAHILSQLQKLPGYEAHNLFLP